MTEEVLYSGGCHCGAVAFEVLAAPDLTVWRCNCSICLMKQNHHFIVPRKKFVLKKGSNNLTLYTFNTGVARHLFCKTCGVQAFYYPRSNPDGIAVTFNCLNDRKAPRSVEFKDFDGKDWERQIKTADIAKFSKL